MGNVNYDVRDQFNQPLLNRAKLIEIIKEEREARERAEGALRRLRNEVHAALGLAELEMRQALGNTNVNCLSNRLREADELLAALKSSQEEGKL